MRVALAYAGRLAESAAIRSLVDDRAAEVVTVTLDFGRGRRLEGVRDRARALGARRAHVIDQRERFAEHFVLPALAAGALGGGSATRLLALADAALAERLIEVASIEEVDAIAHAGDASSRLHRLLTARSLPVPVLALNQESPLASGALEAFRLARGLPADALDIEDRFDVWAADRRDHAGEHADEDPLRDPGEAHVDIAFARGVPAGLNGVSLAPYELITHLGTVASRHRLSAPQVLHAAQRAVTDAVLDAAALPDAARIASAVTAAYEGIIDRGDWFVPLRHALDAFCATLQEGATGTVRLRLQHGTHTTVDTQLGAALSPAGNPLSPTGNQ
ncbi:MAG: argininosuccinate synthase domain-containing protein [Vicinamibacterales bacterium]